MKWRPHKLGNCDKSLKIWTCEKQNFGAIIRLLLVFGWGPHNSCTTYWGIDPLGKSCMTLNTTRSSFLDACSVGLRSVQIRSRSIITVEPVSDVIYVSDITRDQRHSSTISYFHHTVRYVYSYIYFADDLKKTKIATINLVTSLHSNYCYIVHLFFLATLIVIDKNSLIILFSTCTNNCPHIKRSLNHIQHP